MNDAADQAGFAFVQALASDLSGGIVKDPSFPDIVIRINRALKHDNCDVEKLSRIVATEPALAARLLTLANSALLQRGGKEVGDLRSAISRLGHEMVRNVAMSVAVEQIFMGSSLCGQRDRLRAVFRDATDVAAMSFSLAKNLTSINPDEALMAGLLHNVGKLYILMQAANHEEFFDSDETLETVIEGWHGQIGRAIVESWGFSNALAEATALHTDLSSGRSGPVNMTDVITSAWLMSQSAANEEYDYESVGACGRIGLNNDKVTQIRQESREQIEAIAMALRG